MREPPSSLPTNPQSRSCTMEGLDYRALNQMPSTHLPFLSYPYRLANLAAGYTSIFGKGVCEVSPGDYTISGRKRGNLYMVEAEGNASTRS